MKNNKLFALPALLIIICLLSIAASFKQCKDNTVAGLTISDNVNTSQASENGEITAENITANTGAYETSSEISTDTTGKTDSETESDAEITAAQTTSEYGGQNGREAQKFAIIISGVSYNRQQYGWFLGSTAMAFNILKNSGYIDENIFYLFEDNNEPDIDYSSTLSNFKKAIQDIKSRSGIADTILVILIGHGGLNGEDSYYCLSGSNISDIEMAGLFKDIKRDKLIFVFSPCNSGGFVDDLSGNRTLIITSTRKNEANRAAFIEPFLTAFDGFGDTDSDGKVSFAEAFNYASDNVKQQYIDNSWGVLTEHAQLDDNGDKISIEGLVPGGKEGELAGQIFLK
jgi:hypothetical protein